MELPLFDALDPPLVREWRTFHRRNPHVYRLFERFAFEALRTGRRRIGGRLIWERMRWHVRFETTDQTERGVKLNDHHAPYYVREFLRHHPGHAELLETRRSQAEACS